MQLWGEIAEMSQGLHPRVGFFLGGMLFLGGEGVNPHLSSLAPVLTTPGSSWLVSPSEKQLERLENEDSRYPKTGQKGGGGGGGVAAGPAPKPCQGVTGWFRAARLGRDPEVGFTLAEQCCAISRFQSERQQ